MVLRRHRFGACGFFVALFGSSPCVLSQVEFVGEPFDYERTIPDLFFSSVDNTGSLLGTEITGGVPYRQLLEFTDGGGLASVPSGEPGLYLSRALARSHSGRWHAVTAERELENPHGPLLERVEGVYDAVTGAFRVIGAGIGHPSPRALDDSGRRVVGIAPIEGGDGILRDLVWVSDDAGERTLPLPPFPAGRDDFDSCTVAGVSGDGAAIAGTVHWDWSGGRAPLSEAVIWRDEVAERLPHALGGERVASVAHGVSADGAAVLGSSFRYEFVPGEFDSWIRGGTLWWRWEAGVFTHTRDAPFDLVIGGRPLSYAEVLEEVRTDLGGNTLELVQGFSPDGTLMLALLGVGEELDRQAIVAVPCSAADTDADHVITVEDVAAYAARFVDGNDLADLDGDGVLDLSDIGRFIEHYHTGCVW